MTGTPATARLRRLRWTLTLLFAATTAGCLLVLATLAAQIDAHSRARELDNDAGRRAGGLARTLWYDNDTLNVEPLADDELAVGADVLGAVQADPSGGPLLIRWSRPGPDRMPAPALLGRIWTQLQETQESLLVTGPSSTGREIRWAVAPVWEGDTLGAAVIVGDDPAQSRADHGRLVRWVALGCSALVLAAAAMGHLLSGRAMRPALLALEQQEQFLAEAAHELRTPLATLRLAVERGAARPERAPQALEEALRLTDRLGRLVTGLLARARIEAGTQHLELTPLRLDQLVEQAVAELPGHSTVSVLEPAAPVVVRGDPELLAQAVRNLVENALRHGGGTPVTVSTGPGLVTVRDTGPGVPAERREEIFRRGVTGGPAEGAAGVGTGTGLAIVRWVAGLHGGTARVLEAPGGGLQAELRIPPYPPQE
ncbi:two-component system OmpR family sensor kinase [Kitasatospora sp. MAA4]|uniref:sensor histidine kinase n=1 Tax=Kitasatospora sp. MAA4 TaxID=3035093 RepID=UPI002474EB0A|nr:HAMP domain-containing sensor histidine kinase [Kitasatospora sp. MAA4]MDH6135276.1 two-component system OmpR family sensor kinase [Kitasatospora sp. MAA4]